MKRWKDQMKEVEQKQEERTEQKTRDEKTNKPSDTMNQQRKMKSEQTKWGDEQTN